MKDNEFSSVKSRTCGVVEFNVGIIINETELCTPFSVFRIKWLNEFMASLFCKAAKKKTLANRSRVRSPALPDFLSSSWSGTGSTQPREVN